MHMGTGIGTSGHVGRVEELLAANANCRPLIAIICQIVQFGVDGLAFPIFYLHPISISIYY